MKKTLLLLLTALFAVNFVANACNVKVVLHDRDCNGWPTNSLTITYQDSENSNHDMSLSFSSGCQFTSATFDVKDGTDISWSFTGTSTDGFQKWFVVYYDLSSEENRADVTCYESETLTPGDNGNVHIDYQSINVPRTISVIATEGGTVSQSGSNVPGYQHAIQAIPNSGYKFAHWNYNAEGVIAMTSEYTFNVDKDNETYEAVFVAVNGELIGDGNEVMDTVYVPGYTYYTYSISQQIYTSDEVHAGLITSIALYNAGVEMEDEFIPHYDIYMLNVDGKDSFDDDDDWLSVDNEDLVFSGNVVLEYATWTVITLDNAFTLNQDNNLAIIIVSAAEPYDAGEEWGQQKCRVYETNNGLTQAICAYNDDDAYDPTDPSQISSSSEDVLLLSVKNQIILNYDYPTTYNIDVTVNPSIGGTVTGGGIYNEGSTCNLVATPTYNDDYKYRFRGWFDENDELITAEANYSFEVIEDRYITAKFFTNHWVCEDSYLFPDFVSMIAVISIDGDIQNNTMLEVGVFHGDTVRGSGLVAQYGTRYRIFMPIYGVIGHDISFRLYDHSLSMERDDLRCEQVYHIGQLPSSVGTMGNPYEIAFNSKYDVTATVNPEGVGTVSGTGSYFLNEQVTLTAIPSVGNYVFRNWELNGEVVTSNNPYTFLVVGDMAFVANFDYQESTTLPAGYTWWSTSVETNANSLAILKNGLSDKGMEIRAQNGAFVQYDEGEWYGTLGSINNEESYIIRTNANCNVVMTGQEADPLSHPITIHQSINNKDGFTWIGYPVSEQQSVSAAFATFTPTEEDQIWRKDGYIASYYDGVWYVNIPSIENSYMSPGLGYKYLSKSEQEKTLTYAAPSRGGSNGAEATENYYWNTNYYAYPENMSIIAIINVSDIEQRDENLELGAFVNGESRGRTKLINVNGRYYAMLMITGNNGDKVEFGLVDAENNRISMDCLNDITFEANSSVGSFNTPYEVSFTEMIDINRSKLNMYPNPVDRNSMFTLDLPVDETIKEVVITNTVGEVVRTTNSISRIEEGMPVAGVYMIKVVCRSGSVYNGKLIVK